MLDEVRAGKLDARPITMPAIKRTLFLASSKQRAPFKNEAGLTGAVRSSIDLPPLKWSSLKYVLTVEDEINGKEAAYG